MKRGFTLIELMIAITIISIMISFGLSAYGKARDRQSGLNAGEQIMTLLQANQSDASSGNKDCSGKYLGQEVLINTPNSLSWRSLCEGDNGSLKTQTIPDITFNANTTFLFSPLTRGIELIGGASSFDILYTSTSSLAYEIKVTSSGTIEYLGAQ